MKRVLYFLMLVISWGLVSSCEDDDKIYQPDTEDVPLIIPRINQDNNAYVLGDPNSTYSFRVEFDTRGVDIASVEVYRTFADAAETVFTPRVLHTTLTSFPAEVAVPLSEAIQGFQVPDPADATGATLIPLDVSLLAEDDLFIYTFEIVRTDGRRIVYTPLDPTGAITGTQIFEPFAAWAPVVAP